MNKKIIWGVIIVVIVIALISIVYLAYWFNRNQIHGQGSILTTEEVKTLDWKTYTDNKHGFMFMYPPTLMAYESSTTKDGASRFIVEKLSSTTIDLTSGSCDKNFINVIAYDNDFLTDSPFKTTDDYIKNAEDRMTSAGKEISDSTLGNQRTRVFSYTVNGQNTPNLWIANGKILVTANITACKNDSGISDVFNQMIPTFKFTN